MKSETLNKILACKSLPSLPAVALKVIEQTSDRNIKLSDLAATIQNDQGLAAKVLRTVNSSFYGLRSPCSTINRALVLMGLAPVKTLVLGFSLVNAVNEKHSGAFDYVAYWRRGLYTAVASKAIAESAGKSWGDEVFLAGLLQDIGVIAMLNSLGETYLAVIAKAGNHQNLSGAEASDLEITHAEVGAMLAERWKLPMDLVLPVRYHERPTAAPQDYAERCRCVGLANTVHDVLSDDDPRDARVRLYARAKQWFDLDEPAIDAMLRRCADGTKELSRLFKLDTGEFKNVDAIMESAIVRQTEIDHADEPGNDALDGLLRNSVDIDALTGVHARSAFTGLVREALATQPSPGKAAMLLQVGVDATKVGSPQSAEEQDERVVRVASLLERYFGVSGNGVCRLSDDLFAVVMNSADETATRGTLDLIRQELSGIRPTVTVSIGVARVGGAVKTPHDLVVAATKSLHAARQMGGNAVHMGAKAA